MISLELIFVYNARCGSKFKLLHMNIQLLRYHLLKRLLFIYWVIFVPLLRVGYPYIRGSVAGPYSVLFICLRVLIPHCLRYCGFISLEIKYCKLSNFVLLFQSCFGYSRSLAFPYEFWNQLVNVYNKTCWKFDWHYIKSVD